jgi:hypothetical protein
MADDRAQADDHAVTRGSVDRAPARQSAAGVGREVPSVLVILGRASLLVYWVHLEFAFGAAARPFSRRLDLFGWALGSAILLCAMWFMAYVRVMRPRLPFRAQPLASS